MRCSEIPVTDVLDVIRKRWDQTQCAVPFGQLAADLPQYPQRVLRSKVGRMIRRGRIVGCFRLGFSAPPARWWIVNPVVNFPITLAEQSAADASRILYSRRKQVGVHAGRVLENAAMYLYSEAFYVRYCEHWAMELQGIAG